VPIIRAPRGHAAAMVAEKLEQNLRNHLANSRINLFPDKAGVVGYQRPGRPGEPDARGGAREAHVELAALRYWCATQCSSCSTGPWTWRRPSTTRGRTRRSCTTSWTCA